MKIEVYAKSILDSRKEKTIEVSVKSELGIFSSSSPSGKSKGKYEKQAYIGSITNDIAVLEKSSNKISELKILAFSDLIKVEDVIRNKIGANSLFALESAILKALALEQKKQLWQIVNEKAKKLPFPAGNCIGGGMHTRLIKKPDFQEFLIIPKAKNFTDNVFLMKKAHEDIGKRLELRKSKFGLNDENAWSTSLTNEEALDVLNETRNDLINEIDAKIEIGLDVAASTFYTGLVYNYKNKQRRAKVKEQINYLDELVNKFGVFYLEDPLQEEDFSNFAVLRKKTLGKCLIVGDDLIVSNLKRFAFALKNRSINAVVLKPNQTGSLLEIKKLIDIAKKYEIATIMSHRSGETQENILADLAFGFQADFIKTGIIGKEREVKLKRLINIEANR